MAIKTKKVCSHSKQYTSHCSTTLFCANSLSTLLIHTLPLSLSFPLSATLFLLDLELHTLRSHLSRFWHLFSFYFTLSLAVLKMVLFLHSHMEWIPAPILSRQERNARNTSSTVSKTITCEKRDVPHANHKTFHFICVCNNFLAGILGNSLEWTKNVGVRQ